MNAWTCALLRTELSSRGYDPDGKSPGGSIVLDYDQLDEIELGDLLDQMVVRREKIFRSVDVMGKETAQRCWHDAELAIEAIKAVIKRQSS